MRIPTHQYAHNLYGSVLTQEQCEALDAVRADPSCVPLQRLLAELLEADHSTFPALASSLRSHADRDALIIAWVDGIVLEEDQYLMELMTGVSA